MKKFLAILLALCMLLSMVACGAGGEKAPVDETPDVQPTPEQDAEPAPEQDTEPAPEADGGIGDIEVDENLIDVDITLAASFFEGETEEDIKAEAQGQGFKDCKINEDGSVTYTMTKAKHREMLEMMTADMEEMIAEAVDGEEKVESFMSIEHDDNFSVIDIYVDTTVYSPMDSMYALIFFLLGSYYQAFAGVAEEDIDVVVSFIDNNDGETVLDSSSYKTFVANLEAAEQEGTGTEEPAA